MTDPCSHAPGDERQPVHSVIDGNEDSVVVLVVWSTRKPAHIVGDEPQFVKVLGELDACNARLVEPTLIGVTEGCQQVVVDVGGVTFVDGAGIRLLERVHDFVSERSGRVSLHAPSRAIHRVIEALEIVRFNVCEPLADPQDLQR